MGETRTRIVVADDDEATLQLLVTRLELQGYQTFTARDGRRALETISRTMPHGVVLDLGMPQVDGFEVLRALRSNIRFRATPVLVLSGRTSTEDVRKAITLGAQAYLAKPFEAATLLARLALITAHPR